MFSRLGNKVAHCFMAPISEETFIMFSITRNFLGLYEEIEKGQLHQITGGDNKKSTL